MKVSRLYPLTLLALSLSTALSAQENAQYSDDVKQVPDDSSIEKLTVSGQRLQGYRYNEADGASPLSISIKDLPQSVSVIGLEQIRDYSLNDVNTLLNNVTGVNVEEVETDRTYYTARGFDISNFQVDGLGLPVINGNTHGDLDTAIYERVEVIRGANGLMTGVGNPSATVNLVRKKPTEDSLVSVRGQIGSWNNKRLDVDASGKLTDNISGRVVLAKQDKESYLDRYEVDKTVAYGVLSANLSDNTELLVGASQQKSDAKGNMWGALTLFYSDGTPTNFPTSTNTAADWSRWDVTDTRVFASLEHQLSDDWTLNADYMHVDTDEDSLLFYTYSSIDPETGLGLIGYASEYDLDDKQDYADIKLSGVFSAFGQRHDVVFGVNYGHLEYQDRSLYDFHTGNGFPALPAMEDYNGDVIFPELTDTGPEYTSDVTQRQIAYYAATNLSLTSDLNLILGARYNDIEVEGTSYAVDETTDASELVPYAGLVYAVNNNINLYASYTETFQTQTEKDENFERLDPVTGEAAEVGMKASLFDDSALLTVAYFDIKQTNLAVYSADIVNPVTGVPESVYEGSEGINSTGWELDISGELLPNLQTSLGITLFDIDGNDQVEAYTPEKKLNLATNYQFASIPELRVGASVQWQDAIFREQGAIEDVPFYTNQDSYTLVNLMASYDVTDSLRVSANVNNLTDERYLTTLYWAQSFYGAPRNYMLSVNWTY